MDPNDASEALETFKRYTQAFQSLNASAPAEYFHQPALMANPNGVFALPNAAAVERVYQSVMTQLPALRYAKTVFPDLSAQRLSRDLAVVSGASIWQTAAGEEIQRFRMNYTFRRTGGAWKILSALIYESQAQ
jgi:hypothetical protein